MKCVITMAKDDHNTVERITDILEYLAAHKSGVSFSEITRSLCIPKSSLHPLIHTLCKRGLAFFKKDIQRYFIGDLIFSLGSEYRSNVNLLGMINDVIAELAQQVGETCYFGVLSGNEVLYLLKQSASNPIQVTARPGYRLKAYASAIGKALLSQFDKPKLHQLYSEPLESITKNTITSIGTLYEQLSEAKNSGFFYEREESSYYVQCIATPVFHQERVAAAISIAFPILELTTEPDKIQFKKEKLAITAKKVEDLISRNIDEWIYGN
jgi:DNA-binding IclR family transcriptional regulator